MLLLLFWFNITLCQKNKNLHKAAFNEDDYLRGSKHVLSPMSTKNEMKKICNWGSYSADANSTQLQRIWTSTILLIIDPHHALTKFAANLDCRCC